VEVAGLFQQLELWNLTGLLLKEQAQQYSFLNNNLLIVQEISKIWDAMEDYLLRLLNISIITKD